jgi:hypothetical protein
MFDELDDLLAITRTIESSPISNPMMKGNEDIDAVYVDYGDSATPFGAKPTITKVTGKVTEAKPEPDECSGNPTFDDRKKGPLFEEEPDQTSSAGSAIEKPLSELVDGMEQLTNGINDYMASADGSVQQEGLGLGKFSFNECVERGMGRDFMRMYRLECAGQCCPQQNGFRLGDVVHCGNTPALFVVKKADGQMVTAAKPTSNPNELLTACDGEWPTFTFRASEIQPMLNASIDDVQNIVSFNDQAMPFDGSTVDDSPMKVAQNDAKCNMMDRVADNLDEILGMPYKDICSGKDPDCIMQTVPSEVVIINPDGSFGTAPQFGGYKVCVGD